MRRLLLALPFVLLPLAVAHAHDEHEHTHDHEHGSLGAHEHGVARLNAALDDTSLELELESPAMNLVGFEHAVGSDDDKARVAATRARLEQPLNLFNLPAAAGCSVVKQELESPLFGDKPAADEDHDEHSEIHAHYQFTCTTADALKHLDLSGLFKAFPATQKIQVQLVAPSGQHGVEATPSAAILKF
ncbi:DUF2796 domain-containing protein [Pseudomonas akapageensis]|uniref:DUF2796 domain-containing protein n=1 Tax=Pseudomonas akapageensis TaxID=2609961 RepID=UPI00140B5D29|nr:DUF2796 domain-containing protein [Pseudomonas akapageensis]